MTKVILRMILLTVRFLEKTVRFIMEYSNFIYVEERERETSKQVGRGEEGRVGRGL